MSCSSRLNGAELSYRKSAWQRVHSTFPSVGTDDPAQCNLSYLPFIPEVLAPNNLTISYRVLRSFAETRSGVAPRIPPNTSGALAFPHISFYKESVRAAFRLLPQFCVLLMSLSCLVAWTQISSDGKTDLIQHVAQDPQSLVRLAVQKELANTYGRRPFLRYRLQKTSGLHSTTKEIIETKDGGVACLVAVDGHPLTAGEVAREHARLQNLQSNPALQQHRRLRENEDAKHVNNLVRALPDAFLYTYIGQTAGLNGTAIRLHFEPNPKYSSPSYEVRALKGMRGDILIDAQQVRIVSFNSQLFRDVDFGWGLVGTMDKGGTILLEQSDVVPPTWAYTHLHLSFGGRALMVKRIDVDVDETVTDYRTLPADLTYHKAIDILLKENCGGPPANSTHTGNQQ